MKRKDFITLVKQQIPGIYIDENDHWDGIYYGGAQVVVDDDSVEFYYSVKQKQFFPPYAKLFSDEEEYAIALTEIDNSKANQLISLIMKLKEEVDCARKNMRSPHDQLILIHPDCYIPEILKDAKRFYKDTKDHGGLAIISSADWDFSNEGLIDLLYDNSDECFQIWEEDITGCKLIDQARRDFPNLDEMQSFATDFD